MREIKFRGKRIDNDEWVYGSLVIVAHRIFIKDNQNKTSLQSIGLGEATIECVEITLNTVGQFTGLYDKNGKEIYEGDVIRTHFSFSHEVTQEPFTIQWNKDKAMFDGVKQNPQPAEYLRSFSFFPEQEFIYEIIGNIHDNPELLEL